MRWSSEGSPVSALPWWDTLRRMAPLQAGLRGTNAGVVGILVAALYQPVWTSAIASPVDFGLALVAGGLLMLWKAPPWAVVVFCAIAGALVPGI